MNDAFASLEDREFDPKTHGAPELGKDYTPPKPKRSSRSKSKKSLREIAQGMDKTEFTEKQQSD